MQKENPFLNFLKIFNTTTARIIEAIIIITMMILNTKPGFLFFSGTVLFLIILQEYFHRTRGNKMIKEKFKDIKYETKMKNKKLTEYENEGEIQDNKESAGKS